MLHVILDANIIISDFFMKGQQFQNLFNFLKSTGDRLVVPRSVIEEVTKHFDLSCEDAKQRLDLLATRTFGKIGLEALLDTEVGRNSIDKQAASYPEELSSVLSSANRLQIEETSPPLDDLIRHVVHCMKPIKKGGQGVADLLIWYAIKDCLRSCGDCVFISANYKDFADSANPNVLHPDLQKEIADIRSNLSYYQDIYSFLSQRWEKPEGVDVAYLKSLAVYESVLSTVLKEAEKAGDLVSRAIPDPVLGSVGVTAVSGDFDSFYAYSDRANGLLLDVRFTVEAKYHAQVAAPYLASAEGEVQISLDVNCTLKDNSLSFVGVLSRRVKHTRYDLVTPNYGAVNVHFPTAVEWIPESGSFAASQLGDFKPLRIGSGIPYLSSSDQLMVFGLPSVAHGASFWSGERGLGSPLVSNDDGVTRNEASGTGDPNSGAHDAEDEPSDEADSDVEE